MRFLLFLAITFFYCLNVLAQNPSKIFEIDENISKEEAKIVLDSIESNMLKEYYNNDFASVLQYGDIGLKLAESSNNIRKGLKISRFIGSALIKMKDTVRATNVFSKSLENANKLKDSIYIANAITDLGNMYNEIEKYDKAIAYYLQSIEYVKKLNDVRQLYIINFNLAEIYINQENSLKAEFYVNQLHEYIEQLAAPILTSSYYSSIGKLALLQNKPDRAIRFLTKSTDLAKEIEYTEGIVKGYEFWGKALVIKGEYKKAYLLRQKLDKYTTKKNELDKIAAINEAMAKMNVDHYKQELKAKNLENELNRQKASRNEATFYIFFGSSIILVILILILFTFFRKRKLLVLGLQKKNKQYLNAKKEAEKLAKIKSNFLSAITHELRTPLHGIIGISSILQEDVKLNEFQEDLTSLKFSADYLLAMINDLLYLNKLEAYENKELDKKAFILHELITNIENSFEFMLTKNNNKFIVDIAPNVPKYLMGDSMKLSQILINLIGNACKFTEEGTIKVGIQSKHNTTNNIVEINFTVSDNGQGISKEKQHIIFNEFTQDANKSSFEGTGLGLSIVKKLLDLHNATITLESEKNKGTKFEFAITYDIANENEFKETTTKENIDKSIEGSHILIVDDNKINRLITRKVLERNKFVCSEAENGEIAVKLVKNQMFDMILMDINMPIMDGIEATKIISKFANTPILALTATDKNQLDVDIQEIGFTDIIVKPYKDEEFLEKIKCNFLSTIQV